MCSESSCNSCNSSKNDSENCKTDCQEQSLLTLGFSAKEFVDNLMTKGSCLACDDSVNSFNNPDLPIYYDEEMFKRGQAYFYKHMFGMFLANLLGLICGLAVKSSLAILILTNMSSSNFTAYRRYVATILHMMTWYDSEFRPGSRLWESLRDVKSKHNAASKKSLNVLKYRISQSDMALAQFGFMGFAVVRSKMCGIYDKNDEDLKCFIHVWRVIGYVLGMDEKFNLCRESVEETKAICEELLTRVIKPEVEKRNPKHREMCSYLVNGLWAINPFLNLNTFMFYLEATLNNNLSSISNKNLDYQILSWDEKLRLHIVVFVTRIMKFSIIRIILKYLQIHAVWVTKTSPYLAYYKYGKENSLVKIKGGQ